MNALKAQIDECLANIGHKNMLPLQEDAVTSLMNGQDTLVILPPGSGKSLIFQIPTILYRPKLTIVISPLIALMDDQVRRRIGLKAERLHSNLDESQRKEVLKKTRNKEVDILYISPEGLSAKTILDCIKHREIGLFVIDEVHCVSIWGHNFRPSYLFINEIYKQVGCPQLALFTATAPPHIIEDVKKVLEISSINVIMGEPFRDNITFEVAHVSDNEQKVELLHELIRSRTDGSIIIYSSTIKQASGIHRILSEKYEVAIYHSRLTAEERRENSLLFLTGKRRIMICTSAYGMGIDKSDVYTIIHYSIPGSLEDYIQESGRAGRDGKPAKAIIFYHPYDSATQQFFVFQENPSFGKIKGVYRFLFETNRKFTDYQGHPASFAQLRYFLDKLIAEQPWAKTIANSAVGILVDLGYIVRKDDNILFPLGEELAIEEKVLEARVLNRLKRLQLMVNCVREGNNPEMVRRYFKTNIFNEIKLDTRFTISGFDSILSFIARYRVSTTALLSILLGKGTAKDKELYGHYFGIYADVWSGYLKQLLEDLLEKGCIYVAEIGQSRIHFLSEIGETYLIQKKMEVPLDVAIFDVHHHSYRQNIIDELRTWQRKQGLSDKEVALFPIMHHKSFLETKLKIGDRTLTGEELLKCFAMSKSPSVPAFKSLMLFFLGIKEDKTPRKKARFRDHARRLY